ncbi:MAG: hypothetical protein MKZ98_08320 [Pseudomonadales bacterium]|nr:hypothetical protein [Pseudomonadales bacterium]
MSSVGDEKLEPLSSGTAVSIRNTLASMWRGNGSIGVASRVVQALPPLVCLSGRGLFDAGEATELMRAGYTDQLVSILDIDHIEKPRAPIAGVLQD